MEILIWAFRIVTFASFIGIFLLRHRNQKSRIIVLLICIVSFVFSLCFTIYPYFDTKYYDRFGNSYDTISEVVYYTEDECQFTYNEDNMTFISVKNTNNDKYNAVYDSNYAYIDENGYLVLTDCVLEEINNNDFCWYDKTTDRLYMDAVFARWDSNGNLHHL